MYIWTYETGSINYICMNPNNDKTYEYLKLRHTHTCEPGKTNYVCMNPSTDEDEIVYPHRYAQITLIRLIIDEINHPQIWTYEMDKLII